MSKVTRQNRPNDPPTYSGVARFIKAAQDVPEVAAKLQPGKPQFTGAGLRTLDNEPMVFFTDGSLRHAQKLVKGKAARKTFKAYRRVAREVLARANKVSISIQVTPYTEEDNAA